MNCRLPKTVKDGVERIRGFAFIEFSTMNEANKAIQTVNGKKISGRIVAVDFSLPKDKYDSIASVADSEELQQDDESKDDETQDDETQDDDLSDNENSSENEPESEQDFDEEREEIVQVKRPALKGDPQAMIFVRNLSFDSTEQDLKEKYGLIQL